MPMKEILMPAISNLCSRLFAVVLAAIVLLLSQGAGPAQAGALNVDADDAACSDATGAPYCTIGGAVADAVGGATINVFPGAYGESVDLSTMATPGDVGLVAVDDGGAPAPGSVAIESPGGPAITNSVPPFPGKITIDGFTTSSPDDAGVGLSIGDDLLVDNLTSSGNFGDGLRVDANGNAITVNGATLNENGGDGFNPFDTTAPVAVSDTTANGNAEDGMELNVDGTVTVTDSVASGNLGTTFGGDGIFTETNGAVTITGVTADNNAGDGIGTEGDFVAVGIAGTATGPSSVTVEDVSAQGNGDDGFEFDAQGDISVTNALATQNPDDGIEFETLGNVSVSRSTASDNGDHGFEIGAEGTVTVDRVTADRNGNDGLTVDFLIAGTDGATVTNSIFRDNTGEGIDYPDAMGGGARDGHGNIICGNTAGGFGTDAPGAYDLEGNWWGDASGPFHPANNPAGLGDQVLDGGNGSVGTADFDPWIDTITGTNGPAPAGLPKTLLFEVTDATGTTMFMEGPGDPNGPPVFSADTGNGAVDTDGFISDGVLEVTLTAAAAPTATVSVSGPCGLGESTSGNSVVVDVFEGLNVLWGDNDCSGAADSGDALLSLLHQTGTDIDIVDCPDMGAEVDAVPASIHPWGDVDCSGIVDTADVLALLRYEGGLAVQPGQDCPAIGDQVVIVD